MKYASQIPRETIARLRAAFILDLARVGQQLIVDGMHRIGLRILHQRRFSQLAGEGLVGFGDLGHADLRHFFIEHTSGVG